MPFNTAGIFERLYSWLSDRDAGIRIRADRMDAEFDNIKDAINSLTANDMPQRGPIKGYAGSQTAPGYSFEGDANTGLYHAGADSLGLTVGGQNAISVDNSADVSLSNDLSVTGATTLVGPAVVSDVATFNGSADFTGPVTVSGTLTSVPGDKLGLLLEASEVTGVNSAFEIKYNENVADQGSNKTHFGYAGDRNFIRGVRTSIDSDLVVNGVIYGDGIDAWGDGRYLPIGAKAADAGQLDGLDASSFLRADVNDIVAGTLTFQPGNANGALFDSSEASGGVAGIQIIYNDAVVNPLGGNRTLFGLNGENNYIRGNYTYFDTKTIFRADASLDADLTVDGQATFNGSITSNSAIPLDAKHPGDTNASARFVLRYGAGSDADPSGFYLAGGDGAGGVGFNEALRYTANRKKFYIGSAAYDPSKDVLTRGDADAGYMPITSNQRKSIVANADILITAREGDATWTPFPSSVTFDLPPEGIIRLGVTCRMTNNSGVTVNGVMGLKVGGFESHYFYQDGPGPVYRANTLSMVPVVGTPIDVVWGWGANKGVSMAFVEMDIGRAAFQAGVQTVTPIFAVDQGELLLQGSIFPTRCYLEVVEYE